MNPPSSKLETTKKKSRQSYPNAYALKQLGAYAPFYTAGQSGHGWAYDGMGGTTAANTPAIDDFNLG
ncbi:MAG: hypothetical protein P4L83_21645, partial [Nevskia sp.]|nr:hypothetical protein [Nevskia sp.]